MRIDRQSPPMARRVRASLKKKQMEGELAGPRRNGKRIKWQEKEPAFPLFILRPVHF